VAEEQRRGRRHRRRRDVDAPVSSTPEESGVWYPRWYWPSFAAPATLWILLLFVLPFYVVLSVAFGTVDPIFRNPLPVYQPWWWSGEQFAEVLSKFWGSDAIFAPAAVRTIMFVAAASAICLVLGYTVAYYVARYGGRRKGLFLILLISPFWISYLMRVYAWQSLLTEDGYINDIVRFLHLTATPVNWLDGKAITVILGLVYGYIPYMILPIYGQLDRINASLLEAGRDLGASPAQTFWRVTLPLSKQAILAGLVIVTLPMFGDYYTNDLLGTTKTAMYGNLIDTSVANAGQGPQAGALVIILIVLLMIPMAYYMRTTRRAAQA
jgi:ABC-type spermidine/putrescine transport system permease subunit I